MRILSSTEITERLLRAQHQLRRVQDALAQWDEYEAAQLAPDLFPGRVPPTVSRADLKELQAMLVGRIGELEQAWEWRN